MADANEYYLDPRTGRQMRKRQEAQPARPGNDRKRQVGIMFGKLVASPVYKQLKSLADSLTITPYPTDINSGIAWLFAQGRRSGFDLLFWNIEHMARSSERDEMEPQDNMRGSYFLDDEPFSEL